MRRRTNVSLVVTAALTALLVLAGIGYAYWSSTGQGDGTSSTADGLVSLTTTATVAPGVLLYPGGSADLMLDVTNPNAVDVAVTSIALDTGRAIEVDSGHQAGCTVPALTVSTPPGWTGLVVPAEQSSGDITVPGAVSMGDSSSGCQGATFTIPVTLTGRSS